MNTLIKFASITSIALFALLASCAPRDILLPKLGLKPYVLSDFPEGFTPPKSSETGQAMPGFGGRGELPHTPVVFIHGNTVSARYWLPARRHFKQRGFADAGLWALGYGWDNVRYFDSADLSVQSVDRIVNGVMQYLSKETGRPVQQVDIIGHSLGVTLVRQWMKQTNSYHKVRSFIGACGANDGVWTASMDSRGQNRGVAFELAPGSPWLAQLNAGGETRGPTRYMTLYDGTGWGDELFPEPYQDSSALEGAENLAYNRVHGTHYDHLELPREPETMDAMIDFLRRGQEPPERTYRPAIERRGLALQADQADALVHCASGSQYPNAQTAGVRSLNLAMDTLYTCYARNPETGLASALSRYKVGQSAVADQAVQLAADFESNAYENPIKVSLSSNDPGAYIVYSTSGQAPNTGSPLYTEPIYISAPTTLIALAISADGRRSKLLRRDYNISLELIEDEHTLERQFDSAVSVDFEGKRHKGR